MLDYAVLVLPGAYAASVATTVDMLHAAEAVAPSLRLPSPTWQVISPHGGSVELSGRMRIETRRMLRADGSTWIVPGLGAGNSAELKQRLSGDAARRAVNALKRYGMSGRTIAASCSAVFLLQAAGLLAGRRATTSWWLAAELRRIEPTCAVDADRMVVSDGPIVTAGAAFGQADLMLEVLRSRFGPRLADAVGKVLLVDGRQAQSPYVVPSMLASGNALICELTRRIEEALPRPPTVTALAAACAMSPRTLARQVVAATGQGPLALVQLVRLNRARLLIESSRLTIDQIAAQVGYEDPTALRRLMKKVMGANPSSFRNNP